MSGDISAINSWARSTARRALAIAINTGRSAADVKEELIAEEAADAKRVRRASRAIELSRKTRTGITYTRYVAPGSSGE